MEKLTFEESEKNVVPAEIAETERKLGLIFPDNYKKLLLKYNGGLTEGSEWFDTLLSIVYGEQTVEAVISIHKEDETNIPEGYLPIAEDWSANPITLCVKSGEHKDKIIKFYFDSDEEPEVIADTLEELLGVKSMDEL